MEERAAAGDAGASFGMRRREWEREDGWMTRTEERKAQQQEAGVEDPASQ